MKKIVILFIVTCLFSQFSYSQVNEKIRNGWDKMKRSKSNDLVKFNEAKFGMFIHWGLYASLAGEWNGEISPGLSEWVMYHNKIPRTTYSGLAKSFNPVAFNAEEWVLVAKKAGMKYIVLTAKHHDGFAMYNSKVSNYNIYSATPFKRDPLDELYKACKKHGIRFGIYYSQIIDWNDGWDGGMINANRKREDLNKENPMNTWDPKKTTREEYLKTKAYPQIKELVTKYPDMIEIWFDYWLEGKEDVFCTPEISFNFYKILYENAPHILADSRIGSGFGDYLAAGDNEIPLNSKMKYWETPGTVNNTWGYSKYDNDIKTPEEIIFWIVDIASKGGNYLLNVGPKADGTIPKHSVDLLKKVGDWMKVNGESIYGTKKWIVKREGPNDVNIKGTADREEVGFKSKFSKEDFWFTQKNGFVYAISLTKPKNQIIIKSLNNGIGKIKYAQILGYGDVKFKQTQTYLEVEIPKNYNLTLNGFVLKIKV